MTSYKLGRAVLTDSRFSMSARPMKPLPVADVAKRAEVLEKIGDEEYQRQTSGLFLAMDPPEHTRFRRLLAAHYSVRRVSEYRSLIQQVVKERLDAIESVGSPVDLVEMFASPVSMFTHCAVLGVPRSYGELLLWWRRLAQNPHASADELVGARQEVRTRLSGVIERKRVDSADDVICHLLASGQLTDDEILSVVNFLFAAGQDGTENMIALSVFALLCHPKQLTHLRRDPAAIDIAVEELLRYLPILQSGAFTRTAREDVELDGVVIKAGEYVSVSLSIANRDPQKFKDPDKLEFSRSTSGHLGFGQGVHMCLGQHFARVELQEAIGGLLARFPQLMLAVSADAVPLIPSDKHIYGVRQLEVTW